MDPVDMVDSEVVISVGGRHGTFFPGKGFIVSPSPSIRDEAFRNPDDAISNRRRRARRLRKIGRLDLAEAAEAEAKWIQMVAEIFSSRRVPI